MNVAFRCGLFLLMGLSSGLTAVAAAAELRLKSDCQASGAMVTLGQVAEIRAASADESRQLAAMELFPAPASGQSRFLRLRELQDLLASRGIGLAAHRFSGAALVTITGPRSDTAAVAAATPIRKAAMPVRPVKSPSEEALSFSALHRAQQQVEAALNDHFRQAQTGATPLVDVSLTGAQARLVFQANGRLTVRGTPLLREGRQTVELTVETLQGPQTLTAEVVLTLPPQVAVAVRPLARGTIIGPGDVQLQAAATTGDGLRTLEEVIHFETTRAVSAGDVVRPGDIRPRLLVRQGQAVTIHVQAAGIHVRTSGRACTDGSLGELVEIESPQDRHRYFAQVCGAQEAAVFARSLGTSPAK